MIYMAGDNNLSEDMIRGINELKAKIQLMGRKIHNKPNKNNVGFTVRFDGEHPLTPTLFYNLTYTTPKTYPYTSRPIVFPDPPQSDIQTSPKSSGVVEENIRRFIEKSMIEQPARNYALILSGHSDAFQGKTLLLDESPSGVATIQNLNAMLKTFKFPNAGKIDILGFDSCVMNTLEVMYEFKDVAHTWLGSQGSIPNFTWDYGTIGEKLINLSHTPTEHHPVLLTKDKLLQEIFQATQEYNFGFASGGRSMDLSAIDLTNIKDVSELFNLCAFVLALVIQYFGPNSYIGFKILQVLLKAHWNCQSYMQSQSVDIIDFCQRLKKECALTILDILYYKNKIGQPEFKDFNENVQLTEDQILIIQEISQNEENTFTESTLIWLYLIYIGCSEVINSFSKLNIHGSFVGADYQYSNGVSIFLPWSLVGLRMSLDVYGKLSIFNDYPHWFFFLCYYTSRTARPSQPLPHIGSLDEAFEQLIHILDQILFNFTIAKTNSLSENLLNIEIPDFINMVNIDMIRNLLNSLPGEVKDAPPRSKGLENYLHYFSKTNNFYPTFKEEGDIPRK